MKKWTIMAALAAFVAVSAAKPSRVGAADDKVPTIEDIMQKVNKGKGALFTQVKDAVQSGSPDWGNVQKMTKEISALADFLGKNDPPKGDKASWEKLTKAYTEKAKKLNDDAQSKNLSEVQADVKALGGSCQACHRAHRPMK
jgi:cytochrome c556